MPYFSLHNQTGCGFVMIPACFIDAYMIPAAGEYVKVYLCLLRCMSSGEPCSVGSLADSLQHTEGDVLRALHYWEDQGLLRLQFDRHRELVDVTLLPVPGTAQESRPAAAPFSDAPAPVSQTAEAALPGKEPLLSGASSPAPEKSQAESAAGLSPQELLELGNDDAFQEFLLVAQQYLGRTLKPSDCDRFGYWYGLFGRNADLLEYLVEYCADNGHTSLRYMEKVAINWHQGGVSSRAAAREYAESRSGAAYAAMNAFGLKDRAPGGPEQELIQKWQSVYGFSPEMIRLACERTISAIHTPSFQYADKILSSWKSQGLDTPEAVASFDSKRKKKPAEPAAARAPQNRFHNFGQRQYDYSALEDQIYGYHQQKEG